MSTKILIIADNKTIKKIRVLNELFLITLLKFLGQLSDGSPLFLEKLGRIDTDFKGLGEICVNTTQLFGKWTQLAQRFETKNF